MRAALRHVIPCLAAICLARHAAAAEPLAPPPAGIGYAIQARLDPSTRKLTGRETISWTNPTSEAIATLPLHLYLNAFSHMGTTWLRGDPTWRFGLEPETLYNLDADPWGWIEPRAIRQRLRTADGEGERDAAWRFIQPDDGNPFDRSLAEIALPEPVPPGGTATLTIEFEGRLPVPMARTGGRLDFYVVAQWYPKIGVIEPAGVRGATRARVAARQFHSLTEFYADFADYDVTLTVPDGWLVGGTGRAVGDPSPDPAGGGMTHHYRQANVHDAAYVVGGSLRDEWRRVEPEGGGPAVDVRWIVPDGTQYQIDRLHHALAGAMNEMGRRVGPYPYDVLTVATVPWWARETGGMEYPTFFLGDAGDRVNDTWPRSGRRLDEEAVIHEFVHQYFYGVVASNEQEEALLDEGITQYWEEEILRRIYGEPSSLGNLLGRDLRVDDLGSFILERASARILEPMRRIPTALAAGDVWGEQVYSRPARTLDTAARLHGSETLDRVMAAYYRRFAFRHPGMEDFLGAAAEAGGPGIADFLREAFERERVPDYLVAHVETASWEPPLGRVPSASDPNEDPVLVTRENEGDADMAEVGLDPAADEQDGLVTMEITDPGWYRAGSSSPGSVRRVPVRPEREGDSPKREEKEKTYYESSVRLEGPAWDHLPVQVEIRFDDGAVVRDSWDGRAAWRAYRFVRPAKLVSARLDPGDLLRVDAHPANNARAVKPDRSFAVRWAAWFMGLAQWMAGGASLWL
jgi:peptidase M1-like protein